MAYILVNSENWVDGPTPAADEIWQCSDGTVRISAEAAPTEYDGIRLEGGRGVPVKSGTATKVRKVGATPAIIVREAL